MNIVHFIFEFHSYSINYLFLLQRFPWLNLSAIQDQNSFQLILSNYLPFSNAIQPCQLPPHKSQSNSKSIRPTAVNIDYTFNFFDISEEIFSNRIISEIHCFRALRV